MPAENMRRDCAAARCEAPNRSATFVECQISPLSAFLPSFARVTARLRCATSGRVAIYPELFPLSGLRRLDRL